MIQQDLDIIKRTSLFKKLDDDVLRTIIGNEPPRNYPKGKVIFQQGDDAYPSGSYVVARPLKATLNGQTGSDAADAPGYPDKSSYFTVDFGFHTDTANAVTMRLMKAQRGRAGWLVGFMVLLVLAAVAFVWRRRQAM